MTEDEALDFICSNLPLECWFEGKTLTVMARDEITGADKFIKLRLAGIVDRPTSTDLRGEPE